MRPVLPVYTPEHLHDAIPQFFQPVSPYRDGKPKTLIGRPKPSQAHQLSYFIAKIWHRKPTRVKSRQHSVKGDRNNIYWRMYWRHSHATYAVYSLHWDTNELLQLAEYATKAEAVQALTAL